MSQTWSESAHHVLVTADQLCVGMFIAELDRPWLDTPFPLQGLLLESVDDIHRVQQYCRFVYIDARRSSVDIARQFHHRKAERMSSQKLGGLDTLSPATQTHQDIQPRVLPPSSMAGLETDQLSRPPPPTALHNIVQQQTNAERRFEQLKASWSVTDYLRSPSLLRRIFNNFFGSATSFVSLEQSQRTQGIDRGLEIEQDAEQLKQELNLPSSFRISFYRDQESMERELTKAQDTYAQAQKILDTLVSDVQKDIPITLTNVNEVVEEMVASIIRNPDALLWLSRIRKQSSQTYAHSIRVSIFMMALGRLLGFPKDQLNYLGTIGLLLDVGKLKLPRELLEKPGALTEEEFDQVKQHVNLGLQQLTNDKPLPKEVELGIMQHHEREDGSGYPFGLAGSQISIYGRMAAIADTFAAMTSERPYAQTLSAHDALKNLFQWSHAHFHEPLVEKFVQAIGIYPVGALVELNSGEVAVVLEHNRVRRLQPLILILTGPDKKALSYPTEVNLLYQDTANHIPLSIVKSLPAGAYGLNLKDYYLD